MTRSTQTLIAAMVAVGLGMPELAGAQGRSAPAGSSSAGSATARSAPSSGGSSRGSSASTPSTVGSGGGSSAGTPSTAGSSGGSSGPVGAPAGGLTAGQPVPYRNRTGQPAVGTASSVMLGTVTGLPGPIFGPWGRYYPWYSTGFGWNFGFVPLSPYSGSMGLLWGPSYDPFYYDPFNPFGYGYSGFRYGGASGAYGSMTDRAASSPAPTTHATGSIRLKVAPDTAKVYVDGILAGTANQFDGLFGHHLVLESGPHQLELRADGFEAYHETMTVDADRTQTERLSLTKAK